MSKHTHTVAGLKVSAAKKKKIESIFDSIEDAGARKVIKAIDELKAKKKK